MRSTGFSLLLFMIFTGWAAHLDAQRDKLASANRSALRIIAIDVQPANPGADTLCKLRVRIRNSGSEAVTNLTFDVTVGGQRLVPYLNQTWQFELAPGKETELQLFNFWTSESSRPFPKDRRLVVEVRLTGARYRSKDGGSGEVVKPLPPSLSLTLGPKQG